jgi:hypothetical protein
MLNFFCSVSDMVLHCVPLKNTFGRANFKLYFLTKAISFLLCKRSGLNKFLKQTVHNCMNYLLHMYVCVHAWFNSFSHLDTNL